MYSKRGRMVLGKSGGRSKCMRGYRRVLLSPGQVADLVPTRRSSRRPLSVLQTSVRSSTQILIALRNNRKLLGRVKAFDRHANMVRSLSPFDFRQEAR